MNPIQELKKYLKKKSITEASDELKVSRQTIYNWLKDTHGMTVKHLIKIMKSNTHK